MAFAFQNDDDDAVNDNDDDCPTVNVTQLIFVELIKYLACCRCFHTYYITGCPQQLCKALLLFPFYR